VRDTNRRKAAVTLGPRVAAHTLRSFGFRFAIACVVVAVLFTVGVVAGDAYQKKKFNETKSISVPSLVPANPGHPANYLLIGSDSRAGANSSFGPDQGQRSDVMMVLHVDPATQTGMLVSFPRDLIVDIPGRGSGQLNGAYAIGGPDLVVQTLQNDFPPLKINHYIQVDFVGFEQIVNAIGHIKLYFPTPAHDPDSGLNIDQSGCVAVDGATALAYARSREYYVPKDPAHVVPWQWNYDPNFRGKSRGGQGWVATGSDLDRIPRQQYFLRTISQAALDKTSSDPLALNGLLNAVTRNFTHDTTLKQSELQALIRTFDHINPARINMQTLPVAADHRQFGRVIPTDAAQFVISQLQEFTKSPPIPPLLPPNKVKVRVVNGSGIAGIAQRVSDQFTAAGFDVLPPGDADRSDYARTQLRYAPDDYQQGYTVLRAVGTLNLVGAISRQNTGDADVLVVVGKDYDTLQHQFPGTTPSSTATGATSTTTTAPATTTTTTVPQSSFDPRMVPVDSKGGPLVGCKR
jgi:polyisoprenyl-teichoic acid--peptidoglycan teichoic acid transferase